MYLLRDLDKLKNMSKQYLIQVDFAFLNSKNQD
jgi:hypothetical protein